MIDTYAYSMFSKNCSPTDVVKAHIARLREYNELRDLGLRLAQIVSTDKRCSVKEVFAELGHSMNDD